ncbi:MAG: LLM class F420-dependent oxidoreductase [Anaerolineaceae bacterium]|nr:LLM class F420-dependent oxidoreductase [Anaerolineae bacterium]MCB9458292.1 LLM class F420-dependent oxidoreductase [Anaerolineaceae bacterium]
MRVSLQLPMFDYDDLRGSVANIAKTAEDGGLYSLWVMDHFFQLGGPLLGPAENNMLEAYTTLGYIAGVTQRLKLGTLVTGVIYRNPGLLTKAVTTLDVLSGGRAYLGIGAAWYEREAHALGFTYPSMKERFEWLEEALQIVHQMWDESNNGPYEGKHYQLKETINHPQPISQPRPPIMIGGMGENKTLRMVAEYADACNLFARAGIDVLKHKLDVLKEHCDALGRNYDDIEKTALATAYLDDLDTSDKIVALCEELADIGVSHVIFNMPEPEKLVNPQKLADEVIPKVSKL